MFAPATETSPAKVLVIAEIGVNHDGNVERAVTLVNAAHAAGADAVKFQVFDPARLLSNQARLAEYQKGSAADAYELLNKLKLDVDDLLDAREEAEADEMLFIATPFSPGDIAILRELDVDMVKIASPDAVNKPLLDAALELGKPTLISTGACELDEIEYAACLIRNHDPGGCIMQCVSSYPTPNDDAAIGGIRVLTERFTVPVGYSDHTSDIVTGALAVTAGACVLEKHFTYNKDAEGPDHAASLDPVSFTHYADLARKAATMMGPIAKSVREVERDVRQGSRQSVCALRDLPEGHTVTASDVTIKRPGTAIPAAQINGVIGKTLRRSVASNDLIQPDDLV